jgi:hypothetical protein
MQIAHKVYDEMPQALFYKILFQMKLDSTWNQNKLNCANLNIYDK